MTGWSTLLANLTQHMGKTIPKGVFRYLKPAVQEKIEQELQVIFTELFKANAHQHFAYVRLRKLLRRIFNGAEYGVPAK